MNSSNRRYDMHRQTQAELAITIAMGELEKVGAHPLLTEASTLLGQAREKLADYVDENIEKKTP